MIRFADLCDLDWLKNYEHIHESELKNSILAKKVFLQFYNKGFVGWLRYNLFWDSIPFLNMLYLLEEYRGKGYGTRLLQYWEKEMLQSNYKIVLTSTLSNEQGQFFYRKNGYVDCGSLLLPNEPLEIFFLKNLSA